jgi:hypothetical protein
MAGGLTFCALHKSLVTPDRIPPEVNNRMKGHNESERQRLTGTTISTTGAGVQWPSSIPNLSFHTYLNAPEHWIRDKAASSDTPVKISGQIRGRLSDL